MAIEIERKFLVKDDSYKEVAVSSSRIKQGYICNEREKTVRVRIRNGKGYLTIKGPSGIDGLSRYEWEHEIPLSEAEELMKLCLPGTIDKTRFIVEYDGHLFEVDEFYGENEGLVIAEIELKSDNENFDLPDFIGREVTGEIQYYNSYLMRNPYKKWEKSHENCYYKG